jgi:hypothetical protein
MSDTYRVMNDKLLAYGTSQNLLTGQDTGVFTDH